MLNITHAARALGLTSELLRAHAERGSIPEAVQTDDEWLIPVRELGRIAERQNWTVDLGFVQQSVEGTQHHRYASDALAAQAAVLLAKTQATAARFENRGLIRRLRRVNSVAAADRAAREEAAEALAEAQRSLDELRQIHAVAEGKLDELRQQLGNDNRQFQFMVDRIASLENERHRLTQCLGWFGRFRYRRLLIGELDAPLVEHAVGAGDLGLDPPPPPEPERRYPPPQGVPRASDGRFNASPATTRMPEAAIS